MAIGKLNGLPQPHRVDPRAFMMDLMQRHVGLSGLQLQQLGVTFESCICPELGCPGIRLRCVNALHITDRGPTFFRPDAAKVEERPEPAIPGVSGG